MGIELLTRLRTTSGQVSGLQRELVEYSVVTEVTFRLVSFS